MSDWWKTASREQKHDSNRWVNRVIKRRRKTDLAKHHKQVMKALAKATGVKPTPPKRPPNYYKD